MIVYSIKTKIYYICIYWCTFANEGLRSSTHTFSSPFGISHGKFKVPGARHLTEGTTCFP